MCNYGGVEALEAVEVVIETAPSDIERFGQGLRFQRAVTVRPEFLQSDVQPVGRSK